MGPLCPIALESDWPYFEIMGQWSRPTINQGLPPRCAVRELWPEWMETQTQLSELSLLDDTINTKITFTVKPVLRGHTNTDKIKFLKSNGSLMQVEHSTILLTALRDNVSWKTFFFEWLFKTSFTVTFLAGSNFCLAATFVLQLLLSSSYFCLAATFELLLSSSYFCLAATFV